MLNKNCNCKEHQETNEEKPTTEKQVMSSDKPYNTKIPFGADKLKKQFLVAVVISSSMFIIATVGGSNSFASFCGGFAFVCCIGYLVSAAFGLIFNGHESSGKDNTNNLDAISEEKKEDK